MSNFITNLVMLFAEGGSTVVNDPSTWTWVDTIVNAIDQILWPLLIIVGAAGSIYAIILGVNMARADSQDKREEAKKRLINVLVAIAITIALILFFKLLIMEGGILDAIFPGYVYPGAKTA